MQQAFISSLLISNRMFIVAILFVGLLFSVNTLAHQSPTGLYIGGAYLGSEYNDDGELSSFNLSLDDEDDGYTVWLGYRFTDFFSVELVHSDLGRFEFTENSSTPLFDVVDRRIDATGANVVGTWPFAGSGLEIFGKLGFASLRFKERFDTDESSSRGGSQLVGIGLAYTLPDGEALSLLIGVDVHAFSVDASPFDDEEYSQSVVSTYAGLRINFF